MSLQTIFQAENSHVVAIPKDILSRTGLKLGHKVIVDISPDGETINIKRLSKTKTASKSREKAEFENWLTTFMAENGEILDKLAQR